MAAEEASILDLINQEAQTMQPEQLDALCMALSRRKVDEYAAMFEQGRVSD
jgi:hypothetical protein